MSQENPSWEIVFGNDLQHLATTLAEDFFSSTSLPFETRIVVVPDAKLKDFLFQHLSHHPRLNIAAGLQVLPLNQAVMEILDRSSRVSKRKRIPSFLELSLAIEEKLQAVPLKALESYLYALEEEKRGRRAWSLSDELTRCFSKYGLYGQEFLPAWLEVEGWQQTLWKSLFAENSIWTYPLESLQKTKVEFEGKIALFGFSYLSAAHLDFFNPLPVMIYHLSPCALFWEDFTSDKQRVFTKRFFQKKGAAEASLIALDDAMKQRHPLLANWGKLGREMLKSFDRYSFHHREVYEEERQGSLLSGLKTSLLTLDESEELPTDDSIELHSATTKWREIEALLDSLQTFLASDPTLLPRDILIVAPDIYSYAPYIHMVFSQSHFSYTIEGIPLICQSATLQGFSELLQLPHERYSLSSVIQLLKSPSLMEKWGFSLEDVGQLERWFKSAEIKEGLTANPNSWEEGLDRLLYGLSTLPSIQPIYGVWPTSTIAHSEIAVFNRFLEFFDALKKDLSSFAVKKSVSKWMELLLKIAENYFIIDFEKHSFFQELKSLSISCQAMEEEYWNYESISRILTHLFQKPSSQNSSSHLDKITFAPLMPGNLKPSRILWCLGLDESSFPRKERQSSLCQMSKSKGKDYYPTQADIDRSLFLEIFMSAKENLIFSYQRIHAEDGKHQSSSLLIDELAQYLQNRGVEMRKVDHPAFPFDLSYFAEDAFIKKWTQIDYLAAKGYYSPPLLKSAFFNFSCVKQEGCTQIEIRQLKKLARHPLQFYFNETLKIYLKEEEDEEESEFLISHLRKSLLRAKALHVPLEQIVNQLHAQGKMPRGMFAQVSMQELEEETQDLFEQLKKFNVQPEEIHSENITPALEILLEDSQCISITGTLENVTPRGLLFHGDADLKSLIKVWPLYLIYRCLNPENRYLLLTKKGEVMEWDVPDPKRSLATYLDYFLFAKQTPSPFMPDWAKAIVEGKEVDFKESEDSYVTYLQRRECLAALKNTLPFWNPIFQKTFLPLLKGGKDGI